MIILQAAEAAAAAVKREVAGGLGVCGVCVCAPARG